MKTSRVPLIIAIALLLLPVLSAGSYFVLVVPQARIAIHKSARAGSFPYLTHYRFGGTWSLRVYWPLEQIDRRTRPGAWILKVETLHRHHRGT